MSRFDVEKACFALRKGDQAAAFKEDPDAYLALFNLTSDERRAIKDGDIGFLYNLGVVYGALEPIARHFRYDNEAYVTRLREAAGLPECPAQIAVLRRRAALRKKAL